MKTSNCYLCGSNGSTKLWSKNGYFVNKCLKCGFIFVSNIPSKIILDKFYRNFDYHTPDIAERVIRRDAKQSIEKILRFKTSCSSMLDVGCGRGFFLDEAKKVGFDVYGIDSSQRVVKYARETLGLNVLKKDIMSFRPSRTFSVIILSQVIEHFSNPRSIINSCLSLLEPNGLIYIATPNIASLSARITKEGFNYLCPPEHLSYFSKKTLETLLCTNSLRILYKGSWSYSEDLAGIVKALIKPHSIPINDYDGLTIHREKGMSINQRIKYTLFDLIFCKIFYHLLDINGMGSNLEMIAVKN